MFKIYSFVFEVFLIRDVIQVIKTGFIGIDFKEVYNQLGQK